MAHYRNVWCVYEDVIDFRRMECVQKTWHGKIMKWIYSNKIDQDSLYKTSCTPPRTKTLDIFISLVFSDPKR